MELWTGRGRNTKELSEIKDVFGYYNIEKSFLIRKFFQFDSRILVNLSEFLWANLKGLVFSVNVCLCLIKYRKSQDVIIYTRIWHVLYVFRFFKKIGLVDNKIYYEIHKFSNFLLKVLSITDGMVVINNYLKKTNKNILSTVGCFQIEKDGPNIIENIKGDFFNVMGFPLFPFLLFLKKFKIKK